METVYKKCLYCDLMTSEPHFESGCCGRGMCERCYQALVGTTEQIQLDYMEDEDYEKYVEGTNVEASGTDYVCFDHLEDKTKVYKINK